MSPKVRSIQHFTPPASPQASTNSVPWFFLLVEKTSENFHRHPGIELKPAWPEPTSLNDWTIGCFVLSFVARAWLVRASWSGGSPVLGQRGGLSFPVISAGLGHLVGFDLFGGALCSV